VDSAPLCALAAVAAETEVITLQCSLTTMIGFKQRHSGVVEPSMRFFQKPGPKYQLSSWSDTLQCFNCNLCPDLKVITMMFFSIALAAAIRVTMVLLFPTGPVSPRNGMAPSIQTATSGGCRLARSRPKPDGISTAASASSPLFNRCSISAVVLIGGRSGVGDDGMSGRNAQRKLGTTRGSHGARTSPTRLVRAAFSLLWFRSIMRRIPASWSTS
jgi:hypothetical protein